jgi:head-tail adaptor
MKTFSASDLKERIEIFREVETGDGYGGFEVQESFLTKRWANVYAPKARDGVIAMADKVTVSYEVTTRSDLTIKHNDIIIWHGTRMRVKDHRLIQDRKFLSIMCETER